MYACFLIKILHVGKSRVADAELTSFIGNGMIMNTLTYEPVSGIEVFLGNNKTKN